MKAITTLIFLIFFSIVSFSQTIDKLDEKNGFKDFTLGDEFSKWQSQLNFESISDGDINKYQYTGGCCNKIFNYPIELIELLFYNNKLVLISIKTEKFQKSFEESGKYTKYRRDDFESINYSLAQLFGPHKFVDKLQQDGNPAINFSWVGKKVILTSSYVNYGIKDGDRQIIAIADLSYLNKGNKDGF